jgi:hypothetical protein
MPKVAVLTRAFSYTCVALVVMQVATARGVAAEPLAQQCAYAPQTGSMCGSPISGIVVWSDGKPASNVTLDLMPNGPGDIAGWTRDC